MHCRVVTWGYESAFQNPDPDLPKYALLPPGSVVGFTAVASSFIIHLSQLAGRWHGAWKVWSEHLQVFVFVFMIKILQVDELTKVSVI